MAVVESKVHTPHAPQFAFAFGRELIVDLFAGGGGASLGIEQAFGRPVDVAINHNADAVAMHAANHPATKHYISDVFEVDPVEATGGRQVGLLWASPDCKHFSKAKGGAPRSKKIRALAWVVVKWAATVRPRVIMLENVEEFVTWGPLGVDNQPCPRRKGQTFKRWVGRLRSLGYKVEWKELRACDYGAPTIRKRFFLVARCDDLPIHWPAPTHGKPDSPEVNSGKRLPWRSAGQCIDWSIPSHSIFLTKEEGREVRVKRPLADATLRRVAKGVDRFVINSASLYIVSRSQRDDDTPAKSQHHSASQAFLVNTRNGERAGQEPRVRAEEEPYWTITAQGSQGALVDVALAPVLVDVAHADVGRNGSRRWGKGSHSPEAPMKTVTTSQTQALAMAFLTKYRRGSVGSAATDPFPTITANGESLRPGGNPPLALVIAHMEQANTGLVGHSVRSPLSTIVGKGSTQRLVETVVATAGSDTDLERRRAVAAFLREHDVAFEESEQGEALVRIAGVLYAIVDIRLRMLTARELYRAQGIPEGYIIDRTADGRPLPKDAQVRMCGNSVCPPLAKALVKANVGELIAQERSAAFTSVAA